AHRDVTSSPTRRSSDLARALGDGVRVPYDLETIRSAPSFDIDQHISVEQEDMIYHHYGLPPEPGVPAQRPAESRPRGRHRRPDRSEEHTSELQSRENRV